MYLKDRKIRIENIKILRALNDAHIDHKVIAVFMTCEGVPLQEADVSAILNSYDVLGKKKVPGKKAQALINAKLLGEEDDSLPCPAAY